MNTHDSKKLNFNELINTAEASFNKRLMTICHQKNKKINVKIISHNIIHYYTEEKNVYNTSINFFKKVV